MQQIEVIGLPGVGKTTYIRSNIQELQTHLTIIESRNSNLINKIKWKYYTYKFFRIQRNSELYKSILGRKSFRCKYRDVLYFDAGVLQVILEFIISSQIVEITEQKKILKYIINKFNIYISKVWVIEDDFSLIIERELKRKPRRFSQYKRKQLIAAYKCGLTFIEIIKQKYHFDIKNH